MSKRIFLFFICLFFVPLLFAQTPTWVVSPGDQYPSSEYLTAIGEGSDRQSAESTAMAALSRVFGVQINQDSSSQTDYQELTANQKFQSSLSRSMRQTIATSSKRYLVNAQIVEFYQNSASGQCFALAAVARLETVAILQELLAFHNQQMDLLFLIIETESDPLSCYSALRVASIMAPTVENYQQQLLVLSPGLTLPYQFNSRKLALQAKQAARALAFRLEITGDINAVCAAALRRQLTSQGFSVSQGQADYTARGNIALRQSTYGNNYITVANLRLAILNQTGVESVSLDFEAKSTAGSPEIASERAVRAVSDQITSEFLSRFNNVINNRIMDLVN